MAQFKPFQAVRPAAAVADRVAALPYDVYNREEAREAALAEPLSFLNIDRPETQFPEDHDMYAPDVYQRAHDLLQERIGDGTFIRDQKDAYYLYEQTMNGRTQTGIVGCAAVDDYQSGVIKKHENTREEKEQDRIHHVDTCNAQTGPIFLCYPDNPGIDRIVEEVRSSSKPLYDFTSGDGVHNRIFKIDEEKTIRQITEAFAKMGSLYIADGHHRCASAVKVGLKRREKDAHPTGKKEYDYFLSVLFSDKDLMIMDYNRALKDLKGLSAAAFIEAVKEKFSVEKAITFDAALTEEELAKKVKPKKKGSLAMFLDDTWYALTAKPNLFTGDPVGDLDVQILQKEILEPVLGIGDPRTDPRIDFIGGIRGMKELEKRCHSDMRLAFAMYPTGIDELFEVADKGLLMPPKSTWFEPKLLSGLFIHEI